MGRKILFITTDMMRWNSLGYTGDPYAQTPNLDKLAAEGIQYHQARNQHPLCMPCRGSLITGQYPRTNGSWNNGIPLVHDAETIADVLHEAGYRTALIHKHHFLRPTRECFKPQDTTTRIEIQATGTWHYILHPIK